MTSLVDLALQLEAFLVWGSKRCCLKHGLDFQQQNVSEGFIILGVQVPGPQHRLHSQIGRTQVSSILRVMFCSNVSPYRQPDRQDG